MTWIAFCVVYIIGGLTFMPACLLAAFLFLKWYLPEVPDDDGDDADDLLLASQDMDGPITDPELSCSGTAGGTLSDESALASSPLLNSPSSAGSLSGIPTDHLSLKDTGKPSDMAASVSGIHEAEDSGVETYMTGWLTVTTYYYEYPHGQLVKSDSSTGGTTRADAALGSQSSPSPSTSAYTSLYKLVKSSSKTSGGKSNSGSSTLQGSVNDTQDNHRLGSANAVGTSAPKKNKNKFFAVLKHGNLFLYKDANQTDVRHAIVLANHMVTLWPRNLPDSQLFSKRTAICLVRKDRRRASNDYATKPRSSSVASLSEKSSGSRKEVSLLKLLEGDQPPENSFFLYSDDCSLKEDFYFALIRASKRASPQQSGTLHSSGSSKTLLTDQLTDPSIYACTQHFRTDDIIALISSIHSSDSQLQSRWLNALLGRLFLAVHKTPNFEETIRHKIVKKLQRIKKPGFLTDFEVRKVFPGDSAPQFTNLKLRDLSPAGHLMLESHVSYSGGISITIATKVTINLGSRFKTREVPIVLAVTLKKLEGTLLVKLKPPPSNRFWYSFETMPELEMDIEPVVSSRQLKSSIITNAIDSRFREALKESLVMPFMDDMCFLNTEGDLYRGGIWDKSRIHTKTGSTNLATDELQEDPRTDMAKTTSFSTQNESKSSPKLTGRGNVDTEADNFSLSDSNSPGSESPVQPANESSTTSASTGNSKLFTNLRRRVATSDFTKGASSLYMNVMSSTKSKKSSTTNTEKLSTQPFGPALRKTSSTTELSTDSYLSDGAFVGRSDPTISAADMATEHSVPSSFGADTGEIHSEITVSTSTLKNELSETSSSLEAPIGANGSPRKPADEYLRETSYTGSTEYRDVTLTTNDSELITTDMSVVSTASGVEMIQSRRHSKTGKTAKRRTATYNHRGSSQGPANSNLSPTKEAPKPHAFPPEMLEQLNQQYMASLNGSMTKPPLTRKPPPGYSNPAATVVDTVLHRLQTDDEMHQGESSGVADSSRPSENSEQPKVKYPMRKRPPSLRIKENSEKTEKATGKLSQEGPNVENSSQLQENLHSQLDEIAMRELSTIIHEDITEEDVETFEPEKMIINEDTACVDESSPTSGDHSQSRVEEAKV